MPDGFAKYVKEIWLVGFRWYFEPRCSTSSCYRLDASQINSAPSGIDAGIRWEGRMRKMSRQGSKALRRLAPRSGHGSCDR